MTEFQKQRIAYLIKQADRGEWVQLGPGDAEILDITHYNNGYDDGFEDGIQFVVSGEMALEEQKEEALKDTY